MGLNYCPFSLAFYYSYMTQRGKNQKRLYIYFVRVWGVSSINELLNDNPTLSSYLLKKSRFLILGNLNFFLPDIFFQVLSFGKIPMVVVFISNEDTIYSVLHCRDTSLCSSYLSKSQVFGSILFCKSLDTVQMVLRV